MNKQIEYWLPIILLSLIGSGILVTQKLDGGSVEGSMYGHTSAHGLVLSKNLLNSDSLFFMYSSRELHYNKIEYNAYNRFPLFPFLLTGLLIHPFDHQIDFQLYLARQIMNIWFILSVIIVFKLVDNLSGNKYLALSVAFLSFSSYYILTYSDMVFNDTPALFGFVLALYGISRMQKTKAKKTHILFFSLFPICLGWQPLAVFFTWCLVDFIELLLERKTKKNILFNFLKRPSFIVTILAGTGGTIILGLQFLNEWRIVGGNFADLPSVSSGLWRSGLVSAAGHTSLLWALEWPIFLSGQFHSITIMLVPFWPIFKVEPGQNASILIVISLIAYTVIRFLKVRNTTNKFHLILILSGFVWAIPMKHFVALHDFQSIFYIGFAISFYSIVFHRFNLQSWKLLAFNITIVFLISVALNNYYKHPHSSILTHQLQNIYHHLPLNSKIYFDGDKRRISGFSQYTLDLYLSRSIFTPRDKADYAISTNPEYEGEKLTSNSGLNLFKVKD